MISSFCDSLKATYNVDIVVTNLTNVIYSTFDGVAIDSELDQEF